MSALNVFTRGLMLGTCLAVGPVASAAAQEIHHILSYGQSLSIGAYSVAPISVAPQPSDWRFSGGVRPQDSGSDAAVIYNSLVPLRETQNNIFGETPLSGSIHYLRRLQAQENGGAPANISYLASAPGEGSMSLFELRAGTPFFARLVEHISQGYARARDMGRNYDVRAVFWTQGEADTFHSTKTSFYVPELEKLRKAIEQEAHRISGNRNTVPLITYQMASHGYYRKNTPTIALAQLEAAQQYPHIHLATPTYHLDYSDSLHLTAASSQWLGAYYGLVYKRTVIDGMDWQPLHPVKAEAVDNGIGVLASFHVPVPPLVFDEERVINPGDYGFTLVDNKNKKLPLLSINIINDNQILFVTSAIIPKGSRLRYAFNGSAKSGRKAGPRGNLRDSQGDTLVFDANGIVRRMDNWSVIFEIPVESLPKL